jgi:hypothetical protein
MAMDARWAERHGPVAGTEIRREVERIIQALLDGHTDPRGREEVVLAHEPQHPAQCPHSGTPRPPGGSTPSQPRSSLGSAGALSRPEFRVCQTIGIAEGAANRSALTQPQTETTPKPGKA